MTKKTTRGAWAGFEKTSKGWAHVETGNLVDRRRNGHLVVFECGRTVHCVTADAARACASMMTYGDAMIVASK